MTTTNTNPNPTEGGETMARWKRTGDIYTCDGWTIIRTDPKADGIADDGYGSSIRWTLIDPSDYPVDVYDRLRDAKSAKEASTRG